MKDNPHKMEVEFSDKQIKFDKILNSLDVFTIKFCSVLNELKIDYAVISGYVSILFGRSRSSEDIDIFIEKLDYEKFEVLWDKLKETYECLNTTKVKEAYEDYLLKDTSIRFSEKGRFIPNMELKFAKKPTDISAIKDKIKVVVNNEILFTSNLESQIAFKLYLGSEKDIEDARHLFQVFKENLNLAKLDSEIHKLNIKKEVTKYLE